MTSQHMRTTLILIWCILFPTLAITFVANSAGWARLAPTLILLVAGLGATAVLLTGQDTETSHRLGANTADLVAPNVTEPRIEVESWTRRELEVLALIAQGCTNDEIAAELVVSISTVKTHINNIYRKLGVRNRVQALAYARAQGLVA